MIDRILSDKVAGFLSPDKAVIIQGARQVGKTTLIKRLLAGRENVLWVNGDDPTDRLTWDNLSQATIMRYLAGFDYLVIDEAQRIINIGLTVKMIVDGPAQVQVIVSGSSSLDLASSINETLTGRKWTFELFPLSWAEIVGHYQLVPALRQLDQWLVLGAYPEVVTAASAVNERLREIAASYLYKDILEYGAVRKPELIVKLLRALAFQVGSLVSYNELANMLQVSSETIRRYISLLEESHVIFRLEPLSRNPRKEISTSRKIYFIDNGMRNAVIDNLNELNLRDDHGQLWENFIVSEAKKQLSYAGGGGQLYFWRSNNGAEVDLVVVRGGKHQALEIKYNPRKNPRFPTSFLETYQPEKTAVLNRETFSPFFEKGTFG